jgi:hypothetical protein
MERFQNNPVVKFGTERPRLAAWIVLSLGMVILLAIEARDVGLLPTQWLALITATVLVAGACVWIISWEDEDEQEAALTTSETPAAKPTDETSSDE